MPENQFVAQALSNMRSDLNEITQIISRVTMDMERLKKMRDELRSDMGKFEERYKEAMRHNSMMYVPPSFMDFVRDNFAPKQEEEEEERYK